MRPDAYDASSTALLLIDPYNDFISEGGYVLHRRYRPGDYESWKHIAPVQKAAFTSKAFEYGTWGGQIRQEFQPQPVDVVASEHWCSSGFANTDLDLLLKRHGI